MGANAFGGEAIAPMGRSYRARGIASMEAFTDRFSAGSADTGRAAAIRFPVDGSVSRRKGRARHRD